MEIILIHLCRVVTEGEHLGLEEGGIDLQRLLQSLLRHPFGKLKGSDALADDLVPLEAVNRGGVVGTGKRVSVRIEIVPVGILEEIFLCRQGLTVAIQLGENRGERL